MRRSRLLLEAPLALASFALNRAALARALKPMSRAPASDQPRAWKLMDEAFFAPPSVMTAYSLLAPRWNVHAAIAVSPILPVTGRVSVDVAAANAASPRWTLVAYDKQGTVAAVGTTNTEADASWAAIELSPGLYRFVIRLYEPGPGGVVPEVHIDGEPALAALELPEDPTRVYRSLRARGGRRHRALQRYVYPMVRLRRLLGEERVTREYLPVGNPETLFRFGVVERGQRLELRPPDELPDDCGLYLCLYDQSSLPMWFGPILPEGIQTPPAPDHGTWLVRIVPGRHGAPDPARIQVRVMSEKPIA
ncbi:DUF6208 family protein [Haliangium ochraceum]|uniref:Uncharacterized protein n=1 Tax=Haliangium ochraceum (strain DSM 14365 / JCM 11303 / SMP-2) TaxID=502025 RepID=D0LN45_HALO1|nr:DUF6208 family protein [Haliangium ochraceum]ACY13416.1 hypothetical protein Hoch_0800 [Haliangium ochraceum DSM 14365]